MSDYMILAMTVGGISAAFAALGAIERLCRDWLDKLADKLLPEEDAHGQAH